MTSTRNQRLVKRERPLFALALTLLVALLLSACQKEVVEPAERIRAVKTILVADRASGQMRKFPGTVEPVDTSSISFEVTGLVQARPAPRPPRRPRRRRRDWASRRAG